MAHFIVTMTHPNGPGWDRHLNAHITYLKTLLEDGYLIASGPLKHTELRSGFLIFRANTRARVETLIKEDPFSKEGLIERLEVIEWDPLFGAFADWSSGTVPGDATPAKKVIP